MAWVQRTATRCGVKLVVEETGQEDLVVEQVGNLTAQAAIEVGMPSAGPIGFSNHVA